MVISKLKRRQILFTILTSAFILFIFSNSFHNAAESSTQSGNVVEFLQNLLNAAGITISVSEHIIRKLAHFVEYTILGILLAVTLRQFTNRNGTALFVPLFTGLATAVADEFIQLFVGRGSQVQDVVLDFSGVMTGFFMSILCIFLLKIRKVTKAKRTGKKESIHEHSAD